MPRICRPINPMEGRDYLTLDGRVRPAAVICDWPLSGRSVGSAIALYASRNFVPFSGTRNRIHLLARTAAGSRVCANSRVDANAASLASGFEI